MSSIHVIDTKHQVVYDNDIQKINVTLPCGICGRLLQLYMQEEFSDLMEKTGLYKIIYHHKESDEVQPVTISIKFPSVPKLDEKYELEKLKDAEEKRQKT